MRLSIFLLFAAGIIGGIQSASAFQVGRIAVGSSRAEVGMVAAPNEDCQGPVTMVAAGEGTVGILDEINSKIVLLGPTAARDVPLPGDLADLTDIVVTTRGFVVLDAMGKVAAVDGQGSLLDRASAGINPEAGTPRFATGNDGRLYVENLSGERVSAGVDPEKAGVPTGSDGRPSAAGSYRVNGRNTGRISMANDRVTGPLSSITLSSTRRIADASVIWVEPGAGALVALQEYRRLPTEAAFVRLVKIDPAGNPISEAYLRPENFACGTRRPVARLSDGRIVALAVKNGTRLELENVVFQPIGASPAIELGLAAGPSTMLISNETGALERMERANGNTGTILVGLNPISRDQILARARAALELQWHLDQANFARANVPNLCSPPTNIWRRPHRLDAAVGQDVKGIPYKWGGYFQSLDAFAQRLQSGDLAGSVCTCRNGNCVYARAAGLDCSGFVSYAWRTGNYYTTASLPSSNVSFQINWAQLQPGDIVNRVGRHVRLVESVQSSPTGPRVTVIESATNKSCGGVCRRTYSQAELQHQGYVPRRRLALAN